jgi:hypothetical protein
MIGVIGLTATCEVVVPVSEDGMGPIGTCTGWKITGGVGAGGAVIDRSFLGSILSKVGLRCRLIL